MTPDLIKYRFNTGRVFPPHDASATWVIALMAAANDIGYVQTALARVLSQEHPEYEPIYLFRLLISHLREGLMLFDSKRIPGLVKDLICRLPSDEKCKVKTLQAQAEMPKEQATSEKETPLAKPGTFQFLVLRSVRHFTFHYVDNLQKEARRNLDKVGETHMLLGPRTDTRFTVADELMAKSMNSLVRRFLREREAITGENLKQDCASVDQADANPCRPDDAQNVLSDADDEELVRWLVEESHKLVAKFRDVAEILIAAYLRTRPSDSYQRI